MSDETLGNTVDTLIKQISAVDGKVDTLDGKVEEIKVAIIGDLTDESKPGMHLRLDRTERTLKLLKGVIVFIGGILGTVVAALILRAV